MKTLTCDFCGDFVSEGESNKEVMDKMWEHIKKAHPDMKAKMKSMSKDEQKEMMMESEKKIVDTPM